VDPQPEQVQVDPAGIIKHQQAMTTQLVGQFLNDLAITRALLDDARSEVDRLTRVTEELRSATTTPTESG
jgi:hypothetical protein